MIKYSIDSCNIFTLCSLPLFEDTTITGVIVLSSSFRICLHKSTTSLSIASSLITIKEGMFFNAISICSVLTLINLYSGSFLNNSLNIHIEESSSSMIYISCTIYLLLCFYFQIIIYRKQRFFQVFFRFFLISIFLFRTSVISFVLIAGNALFNLYTFLYKRSIILFLFLFNLSTKT